SQVTVPVVKTQNGAADQGQVAAARSIGRHGHGRDRRETGDAVRPILLDGIGVGRGDNLGDFIPVRPHQSTPAAPGHPTGTGLGILHNGSPGSHRRHGLTGFPPGLQETGTAHGILDTGTGVEIPAIAGAPGTASGFVVGQVRAGTGIVGLLGFPGDDPTFHINLPGAGAGTVHPMGGADDLVSGPTLSVSVLPGPGFVGGDSVSFGKCIPATAEVCQAIEKVAHDIPFLGGSLHRTYCWPEQSSNALSRQERTPRPCSRPDFLLLYTKGRLSLTMGNAGDQPWNTHRCSFLHSSPCSAPSTPITDCPATATQTNRSGSVAWP